MFLEIAILSYNRIVELERALSHLVHINRNDVKVTVYEDCSPNQKIIKDICEKFTNKLMMPIEFNPSPKNLGYDGNLMRALSSSSKYVLLLSDDDFIIPERIDDVLLHLYENEPDIAISPFSKKDKQYRLGRHYNGEYTVDVLYDSILFSGLIFKTSVIDLSIDEILFLSNSIYTQIYLVGKHWNKSCYYLNVSLIVAGEDGDNYFGLSDATRDKKELVDREALMSNLYYQASMQKVAFLLINDFHPELAEKFIVNYSRRLVSHYIKVRLSSNLLAYIKSVLELFNIDISYIRYYLFFIFLIVLTPKIFLRPVFNFAISRFRISGG